MATLLPTPPRLPPACMIEDAPETPGPIRARVNNLQNQVSELVRREHAATRKHKSETSALETTISAQKTQLADSQVRMKALEKEMQGVRNELGRCKAEGDGMRDELNLHSMVAQHKALLALAEEQMHVVELERRLVQAETARVMRDHKIALFKAKEDDMAAEMMEKDIQLDELEAALQKANTSLAHQRAASGKHAKGEAAELESTREALEESRTEIQKLEGKVRVLREREKEARGELEGWLREERGKEGSANKEKTELKTQLRHLKSELHKTKEELGDAQDELAQLQESSKEREKALKMKIKEMSAERDRLASMAGEDEEELRPVKVAAKKASSPVKKAAAKERVRKTSPVAASDTDPSPKKKCRKVVTAPPSDSESDSEPAAKPKAKPKAATTLSKAPLRESSEDNKKDAAVAKAIGSKTKGKASSAGSEEKEAEAEDHADKGAEGGAGAGEKKKKRKLFGGKPAFTWDPIMNSGDGGIPTFLSPVKPSGTATGTIPRIGFPSAASRSRLAM